MNEKILEKKVRLHKKTTKFLSLDLKRSLPPNIKASLSDAVGRRSFATRSKCQRVKALLPRTFMYSGKRAARTRRGLSFLCTDSLALFAFPGQYVSLRALAPSDCQRLLHPNLWVPRSSPVGVHSTDEGGIICHQGRGAGSCTPVLVAPPVLGCMPREPVCSLAPFVRTCPRTHHNSQSNLCSA